EFYPLPETPVYINDRNNLELADTLALPASYSLQWYLFSGPIAGATGFEYCATMNGEYTLVLTDLTTGCTNSYTTSVTVDPAYDCTVGTRDAVTGTLTVFPNPAHDQVTVQLPVPLQQNSTLRIWDIAGRLVEQLPVGSGVNQINMACNDRNPGVYVLELQQADKRYIGRLVILR
ncbi:MAG: T9SS type A sorting domain-containing protein, partial [Bacteroidetes bacterium]